MTRWRYDPDAEDVDVQGTLPFEEQTYKTRPARRPQRVNGVPVGPRYVAPADRMPKKLKRPSLLSEEAWED